MRTVLRWVERLFFAVATVSLCAVAWSYWEAARFRAAAHELALAADASAIRGASPSDIPSEAVNGREPAGDNLNGAGVGTGGEAETTASQPVALPNLIGELVIPHLRIAAAILEGDDPRELRRGVGHRIGSALPGEPGNVVLAGHRDGVFRRLGEIQRGDRLRISTRSGTFDYRVIRTMRVKPQDVWVLRRDAAPLTLITCYPFTWVGPAPERWIVQAAPMSSADLDEGRE